MLAPRRWFYSFVFAFLITVVFAVTGQSAQAQAEGESDFSLMLGNMLPNQIEGVDLILPVFGGRYAYSTRLGAIEGGLFNTHAEGVDFTTLELSVRGEFPVDEGLSGLLYAGADFNYYTRAGESSRRSETGLHIGTGGMLHITGNLWLRGDLKFMGGPGTSLFLLAGLVFRPEGAGGVR